MAAHQNISSPDLESVRRGGRLEVFAKSASILPPADIVRNDSNIQLSPTNYSTSFMMSPNLEFLVESGPHASTFEQARQLVNRRS